MERREITYQNPGIVWDDYFSHTKINSTAGLLIRDAIANCCLHPNSSMGLPVVATMKDPSSFDTYFSVPLFSESINDVVVSCLCETITQSST